MNYCRCEPHFEMPDTTHCSRCHEPLESRHNVEEPVTTPSEKDKAEAEALVRDIFKEEAIIISGGVNEEALIFGIAIALAQRGKEVYAECEQIADDPSKKCPNGYNCNEEIRRAIRAKSEEI